MNTTKLFLTLSVLAGQMIGTAAFAGENVINITAQKGSYVPATIQGEAGQKITLHVKNTDTETVEFESYPLNREVKIQPNEEKEIIIDAQKPGSYEFFDDNNPDAKGVLIIK